MDSIGEFRSASRDFYLVERKKFKVSKSVEELVDILRSGPRSADDIAADLGISRSAAIKRVFSARQEGFNINLCSKLYRLIGGDRTCPQCGKKLSQYNKTGFCFNYPDCFVNAN
jgi:biotin operon repressor